MANDVLSTTQGTGKPAEQAPPAGGFRARRAQIHSARAARRTAKSIKRTPWKVDIRNRLTRIREDMEMAVRANGWEITGAPGWPCAGNKLDDCSIGKIKLKPQDGVAATVQMRQAEAVVVATFGYMAKTQATLEQSTEIWQRPWEWLTGGLLMSAYTSLHAAETSRILLLGGDQLVSLLPTIRGRAVKYLPANDPNLEALKALPDPTAPATLTRMLGRDQRIASVVMCEATHAEDQQQSEVRRFRGVLLGTFLGLLIVVILLVVWGILYPRYFPLCVQKQLTHGTTTVCPTGGSTPGPADLALVMAIGGLGAVLAVAINLKALKPTGVRYSLSVAQGLIKIPFGAITAMLGIIIVGSQSSIRILTTPAGLLSTAAVFGYSQQLFTNFIDKQANSLLDKAGGDAAGAAGS